MMDKSPNPADVVTLPLSLDAALVLYGMLCRYFLAGDETLTDVKSPSGEF
jgi:hypothetical protein